MVFLSLIGLVGIGHLSAKKNQEDPWAGVGKGFAVWASCVALSFVITFMRVWLMKFVRVWLSRRNRDPGESHQGEP